MRCAYSDRRRRSRRSDHKQGDLKGCGRTATRARSGLVRTASPPTPVAPADPLGPSYRRRGGVQLRRNTSCPRRGLGACYVTSGIDINKGPSPAPRSSGTPNLVPSLRFSVNGTCDGRATSFFISKTPTLTSRHASGGRATGCSYGHTLAAFGRITIGG